MDRSPILLHLINLLEILIWLMLPLNYSCNDKRQELWNVHSRVYFIVIIKEKVGKLKWHNSWSILSLFLWMILLHQERNPEELLVREILDVLGGLKSYGCTRVWQGWYILTLFNPVPKCYFHPSLVWSLGKLSTGIRFLFGWEAPTLGQYCAASQNLVALSSKTLFSCEGMSSEGDKN